MEELLHIIYASAATTPINQADLLKMLERSREKNARLGITGILLHSEGSFFQVLEGKEDAVENIFETIQHDQRHVNITVIIRETIAKRAFPEWSMAFANATNEQLKEIEGLNDFFQGGSCLADIDEGRAKKILKAFEKGHWRTKLNEQ
jgi:hypothetical protein